MMNLLVVRHPLRASAVRQSVHRPPFSKMFFSNKQLSLTSNCHNQIAQISLQLTTRKGLSTELRNKDQTQKAQKCDNNRQIEFLFLPKKKKMSLPPPLFGFRKIQMLLNEISN